MLMWFQRRVNDFTEPYPRGLAAWCAAFHASVNRGASSRIVRGSAERRRDILAG